MTDWIHTGRGITLVEGTLPRIARGLKRLADLLDTAEVEYDVCFSDESPGPGWEPIGVYQDTASFGWRKRKED